MYYTSLCCAMHNMACGSCLVGLQTAGQASHEADSPGSDETECPWVSGHWCVLLESRHVMTPARVKSSRPSRARGRGGALRISSRAVISSSVAQETGCLVDMSYLHHIPLVHIGSPGFDDWLGRGRLTGHRLAAEQRPGCSSTASSPRPVGRFG